LSPPDTARAIEVGNEHATAVAMAHTRNMTRSRRSK